MSNLGLFKMGDDNNISIAKTKVGDRYVLQEMIDRGYCLGGEQSGHVIFLDYNTTGDGLVTSLQLTKIIKNSEKTLDELAKIITIYPQVLENARVERSGDSDYIEDEDIMNEISRLNVKYNGRGRVLIRPSGTEPLIRVMIEGEDIREIGRDAKALADLIGKKLRKA